MPAPLEGDEDHLHTGVVQGRDHDVGVRHELVTSSSRGEAAAAASLFIP